MLVARGLVASDVGATAGPVVNVVTKVDAIAIADSVVPTYVQRKLVSVTNISVENVRVDNACFAGVRFNNDGTIDAIGPTAGASSQIHPGEWYVEGPQADIGDDYQVRCQSIVSGSWGQQAAAVGTWVDINDVQWMVSRVLMVGPGTTGCSANFQIRRKSDNAILASFVVTCTATVELGSEFSVTASNVNAQNSGPSASGSVSGGTTATPSGNLGTVTYQWTHLSTSSGNTPSISSNTTQSPTFTATVSDAVNSVSTWRVTATDTATSEQDTHNITVTLDWVDTSAVPNVTNISVSSTNPGGAAHSGVLFADDGSIYEIGPGIAQMTKIHAGEWWPNEPEPGVGSDWEIRCQSLTSGTWTAQAAAVGSWVSLSTDPEWRVSRLAMAGSGTTSVIATFQIRDASTGTIVDTFTVNAAASN